MEPIVTSELFRAHLYCPLKCIRILTNEAEDEESCCAWLRARDLAYFDSRIEKTNLCGLPHREQMFCDDETIDQV